MRMTEEKVLHREAMRAVNKSYSFLKGNKEFELWLQIHIERFLDEIGYDIQFFRETIEANLEEAMDAGDFSSVDLEDETEALIQAEERRQKFFDE